MSITNTSRKAIRLIMLTLAGIVLLNATSSHALKYTWTGGGTNGSVWHDPDNWDNGVPGLISTGLDTVIIGANQNVELTGEPPPQSPTQPGDHWIARIECHGSLRITGGSLTVNGPSEVASFMLGSTLSGTGPVHVTEAMDWAEGAIHGTVIIDPLASLVIRDNHAKTLYGRLVIDGTGTIRAAGVVDGALHTTGVATVRGVLEGAGTLINQGQLLLVNGSVGVPLANEGLLRVQGTTNGTIVGPFTNKVGGTLHLESERVGQSDRNAWLTIDQGFVNEGVVHLVSSTGGLSIRLTVNNGPLVNAPGGTIRASGVVIRDGRTLTGSIDNQGTIDIDQTLFVTNSGGFLRSTDGDLDILSGRTLTVAGGSAHLGSGTGLVGSGTVDLAAPTLELVSDLTIPSSGVRFAFGGAVRISGAGRLINQGSILLEGDKVDVAFDNEGQVEAKGATTQINGPFYNSGSLLVTAERVGQSNRNGWLTIAQGFTNDGLVEMTSNDGAPSSRLTVTSGTLTNGPGGTLRSSGVRNLRILTASIDNQGTVDIDQNLSLTNSGGSFRSSDGALDILSGTTLTVGGGSAHLGTGTGLVGSGTVDFVVPTLELTSDLTIPSGGVRFAFGGAVQITGAGRLTNQGSILFDNERVEVEMDNQSFMHVKGTATAINGSFNNSGTLRLEAERVGQSNRNGWMTFARGFTNDGMIDLLSTTGGYSVRMTLTSGTLTNLPGGVIRSSGIGIRDGRFLSAAIDNQGTIDIQQALLVNSISSPVSYSSSGLIQVVGGDLTLSFGAPSTFTNTGTIQISSGRTLALSGGGIFTNFSANTLTGGSYDITGTLRFHNAAISTNAATVIMNGAGSRIVDQRDDNALTNLAANSPDGDFTIQNGRSLSTSGAFANAGAMTVGNSSTFNAAGNYSQSGGSTVLAGGNLTASSTVDIQAGLLAGDGTVNAVVINAGEVGPGASPGMLNITGDYSQTSTGRLSVELGGTVAGSEFDRLNVTGTATLDGRLALGLVDGFEPADEHAFQIMTYGSRAGDFVSVTGADLTGNRILVPELNVGDLTLLVGDLNQAPVATADIYSVDEDNVLNVPAPGVLSNDTDADGGALTAVFSSGPSSGTLSLDPEGSFRYTPGLNFNGSDRFSYRSSDGSAHSEAVTVTITIHPVNDAPVAIADVVSLAEDNTASFDVLGNDIDVDGDALVVVSLTQPANGVTAVLPDNSVSYTPSADFYGDDSFTYQSSDGAMQSTVTTVAISVAAVNDAPVATADAATGIEDIPVSIAVLANDTDVEGDALSVAVVNQPANGLATVNPDNTVTYTPSSGFSGDDSFSYQASDGTDLSLAVTVSITVQPANRPPEAVNDTYTTAEDEALVVVAPGVLLNDTDTDGDALTSTLISTASHGSLVLRADGSFSYTPAADFHGSDSFTYKASDGSLASLSRTVTVVVSSINDRPEFASPADQVLDEGATVNATIEVVDPDGSIPLLTATNLPVFASFLDNGNGTGTLTLTPDFTQAGVYEDVWISAVDADDPTVTTTATLTLTVNNVNLPPTLDPIGDQAVNEGDLLEFTVTAHSPDGDVLSFAATNLPPGASFDGTTGTFSWIPSYTQSGIHSGLRFEVSDGTLTDFENIDLTVHESRFFSDVHILADQIGSPSSNATSTILDAALVADAQGDAHAVVLIRRESSSWGNTTIEDLLYYTPDVSRGADGFIELDDFPVDRFNAARDRPVRDISVALDSDGEAHVTYVARSGRDLSQTEIRVLTHLTDSQPLTTLMFETGQDVEVFDAVGERVSGIRDLAHPVVRIDQARRVHVAFYATGWVSTGIRTAVVLHASMDDRRQQGPTTASLLVPIEELADTRLDLQVDVAGDYHIAVADRYATNSGGNVSAQRIPNPVPSQGPLFSDVSLMLNSAGVPQIIYGLAADGVSEVYLAQLTSGAFVSERMSDSAASGAETRAPLAAVDAENSLHVLYMVQGQESADVVYQSHSHGILGSPLVVLSGGDAGGPHNFADAGNGNRFDIDDSGHFHALTTEVSRLHYHKTVVQQAPLQLPPQIAQIEDQSVDEGQPFSLTVAASDGNGVPVGTALIRVPQQRDLAPGMAFDPATATFSWTPGFAQSGIYPVAFVASDHSSSVTDEVIITVRDVAVPDLTVISVEATDFGDRLSFTAGLENLNNGPAVGVDVVLTVISSTGIRELIGRPTIPLIDGGDEAQVTADWTPTPGDWEIEVSIDPDNRIAEADELNNLFTEDFTTLPDLTVELEVIPAAAAGEPYRLIANITSDSRETLVNVQVSFTQSSAGALNTIGPVQVIPTIAPGESVSLSVEWIGQRGDWNLGVQVDPARVIEESDESNNDAWVAVVHYPDLVAGELTLSETSTSGTFQVSLPITNLGPDPSPTTRVRFEGQREGVTGRDFLGEATVAVGSFGGTQIATVTWAASPGRWSLEAVIDPHDEIRELDETNNVATSDFDRLPDLVAGALLVTETTEENVLRVSLVVSNTGFMDAMSVPVNFDAIGPDGHTSIGQVSMPPIAQGESVTAALNWSPTPGNWELTARVDPGSGVTEMSEDNNTRVINFSQGVKFQVVSQHNGSTQADVVGRFVSGVPALNTFTVVPTLTGGDPSSLDVHYRLGGGPAVQVLGPDFSFSIDMGELSPGSTELTVTMKDANDPDGTTKSLQLECMQLPGLLGFLRENGLLVSIFHNGVYQFKSNFPSVFPGIPFDFSPVSDLSEQFSSVESEFQELARKHPNLPGDPFEAVSQMQKQLEGELQDELPWVGDFTEARAEILNSFPVVEAKALKKIPIIGQLQSAIAFVQDLDITYDVGSNQGSAGHFDGLLRAEVFGLSGKFETSVDVQVDADLNLTLIGTTVIDPEREQIFDRPLFQTRQRFDLFIGVPVTVTVKISARVGAGLDSKITIDENVELAETTGFAGDATITGQLSAKVSVFWGVASAKLGIYPIAEFGVAAEYTEVDGLETGIYGTLSIKWKAVAKIAGFKKKKRGTLYEGTLFGDAPSLKGLAIDDDELLEPIDESDNFATPHVAADANGNAMVIWVDDVDPRQDAVDPDLFYALWDGTGFSTARTVVQPNQAGEMDPVVAFDNLGNAFAVWTQNKVPLGLTPTLTEALISLDIYYARWDGQTGRWSDPRPITNDSLPDGQVSLSFDTEGNGLALWVHCLDADLLTRNDWEIHYAVWDPVAQSWSDPAPVSHNSAADYDVTVAHAPDGTAVAVWAQDGDGDFLDTSDSDLFSAAWDGTAWTPSQRITADSQIEDQPDLVFSADGTAYLLWHADEEIPDPNGVDRLIVIDRLVVSQWDAQSQFWSEPHEVLRSDQFLDEPQIAIRAEGGTESLVIHWRGYDDFDGDLFSASLDPAAPGAGLDHVIQITEDDFNDWGTVTAVDASGQVLLASMKHDLGGADDPIRPAGDLPGGMNLLVQGADGVYAEPERSQVLVAAITAAEKIEIGKSVQILGDVTSGGELKIKKGDKKRPGRIEGALTAAQDIKIEGFNHVAGDVTAADEVELPKKKHADTVVIDGTIVEGGRVDPVELPAVFFRVNASGGPRIDVKKREAADLLPNDDTNPAYGRLKVDHGATVKLHSGTYYFDRFELKHEAELIIELEAGAPITINVKDGVYLGHHSTTTIVGGDAGHVLFNVSGLGILDPEADGKGKSKLASRIGHDAQFAGTIYSPQGKLEVEQNSTIVGALIGREVKIAGGAVFTGNLARHLDLFFRPLIVAKPVATYAAGELPDGFDLLPNYPNPFNLETTIGFNLSEPDHVRLEIFDVLGQRVRTLLEERLPPGQYSLNWNGRNDAGKTVSSGVYFYRIEAGAYNAMKGMVLIK
jgi:VCBS repeat-containing protein